MRRMRRRLLSLALCALLCAPALAAPPARAAGRVLLLEQAQSMAISRDTAISKKNNEIILKQMKYIEAVDGIKAKIKNLRSFRWSPLLSFHFPEQLDMTEEYELNIKPLTLQAEITTLRHELKDLRYAASAAASKEYLEVYLLQEKVAFCQARLLAAQSELARNQARLITGDAVQTDIDNMQRSVDTLTGELAALKRNFQTAKETLSDRIRLDITSGYTFRNPLKELSLPREELDGILSYTLENDQTLYAARMSASTALINLNSYESLMRNHYGSKLNAVQTFVDMAKSGQDIDYSAFMLRYKAMLKDFDQPWSGKIRILFFRFTKEWFKGAIDGTRYIEDEIYALYTACMEYANARRDEESTEKDLRKRVSAQYEQIVSAWSSYESLAGMVVSSKETLDKVSALNQLGKASYDELKTAREDYESIQLDALDALAAYNTMLYDFDRLTCGAISSYLKGISLERETGGQGDSFSRLDPIQDPYYYLYTTVEDLTFHLGVSIPDGFTPEITSFELWSGQIQIGERTPVTEEITHLTLDYGGDSILTLRFYDGESYVSQCEIDATVPRDVLQLEGEHAAAPVQEAPAGSYEISTSSTGGISTSTLTLHVNRDLGAASYTITYGTASIYTSEHIPVEEPFHYLTILISSLEQVQLNLFDRQGGFIQTLRFEPQTQTLYAVLS